MIRVRKLEQLTKYTQGDEQIQIINPQETMIKRLCAVRAVQFAEYMLQRYKRQPNVSETNFKL